MKIYKIELEVQNHGCQENDEVIELLRQKLDSKCMEVDVKKFETVEIDYDIFSSIKSKKLREEYITTLHKVQYMQANYEYEKALDQAVDFD